MRCGFESPGVQCHGLQATKPRTSEGPAQPRLKGHSTFFFSFYFVLRRQKHFSCFPAPHCWDGTIPSGISGHPSVIHREKKMWCGWHRKGGTWRSPFWSPPAVDIVWGQQILEAGSFIMHMLIPGASYSSYKCICCNVFSPCLWVIKLCLEGSCMSTTKISSGHEVSLPLPGSLGEFLQSWNPLKVSYSIF